MTVGPKVLSQLEPMMHSTPPFNMGVSITPKILVSAL